MAGSSPVGPMLPGDGGAIHRKREPDRRAALDARENGQMTPLVLLDLDGTLADSAPGIVASVAQAYRALGLEVPGADALRSFVGPPITDSFAAHGVAMDRMDEAVSAYRTAYTAGGMDDVSVFPGVTDALVALRDAGCRLIVATSKPTVFARPICEDLGLSKYLDAVVGAPLDEHTSTKALVIAEALAEARHRGNPADTGDVVMVGDREHDVHGAATHGIGCLGVAWGYAAPGELATAGALEVVADVQDLAPRVLDVLGAPLPLT